MMRSTKDKDSGISLSRYFRNIVLYIRIHKSLVRKGTIVIATVTLLILIGTMNRHHRRHHNRNPPRLRSSHNLPSSLTTSPILSLYEPGHSQFNKIFTEVPLLQRWQLSPTTHVLRFGLPNLEESLQLSTCACLLVQGPRAIDDDPADSDEFVIRPYTPISTNTQIGSFDLFLKDYGGSTLSNYLTQSLRVGDTISVSHGPFQVKIQASDFMKKTTIGMIAGGTGITPMIQAVHAILGDPSSTTKIVLLYSAKVESELYGTKELFDSWMQQYPERLKVVYTLTQAPGGDGSWTGERGRISQSMIAQQFPSPQDEHIMIFLCGPTSMYATFAGPRMDKELTGVLADMGYTQEQVYKF
mmetsp:Transcript_2484/g.3657  ORF Transcript_2484/g.3657 Transcript_2484/m.3657 type:complete len:356 (+) Transcript_2484:38-1105(+)